MLALTWLNSCQLSLKTLHVRSLESPAAQHPWGFLMGAFAEVARHDPRPAVADAAAAALVEVVQAHCRGWDAPSWQAAHVRVSNLLLDGAHIALCDRTSR